MFHYRRVALTLIAAGALAFTTTGVPAAFGADADATQASSSQQAGDDSPSTIIVQLDARDDGVDRAAYYAQMKTRIGEAVAAASPGATISNAACLISVWEYRRGNAILERHRGVAQLGSALRSGRRGRGFKSRHPDR